MKRNFYLLLLCLAYLALGAAFSLVVPLAESPDELDHLRYIQFLVQRRRLPIMAPVAADNATMEANQPPLYYLFGALAWGPTYDAPFSTGLTDEETADMPASGLVSFAHQPCFTTRPYDVGRDLFYRHTNAETLPYQGHYAAFWRVRLFSVLLGLGTVLLTFKLGRQLAPENEAVAWLALILVAFNPQFLFISASVNNDNLMALLGAATLVMSIDVYHRPTIRRLLLLGLILGMGALTKLGLFALWPVAGLSVLLPAWQAEGKNRWRRFLSGGILLGGPVLLIAGWWYLRAQLLYGDPLVWDVHLQAKGSEVLRTGPFAAADFIHFISVHFQTYWGRFGWLNVALPPWVYWLLALFVVLSLAGLALVLRDMYRQLKKPVVRINISRLTLLLSILATLGVYLSLFRYIQTINWSGYQGRLAFAALAPVAVLLALGLWRLGDRFLGLTAAGGLALLALGSLLVWLPAAYPRDALFEPVVAERQLLCARLDHWELESIALLDRVKPGQSMTVELHGYGLGDDSSFPVQLDLVGADGVIVGQGSETFAVVKGALSTKQLLVSLAADARPARGLLRISSPTVDEITNADGQSLETPLPLGYVKIEPSSVVNPAPQVDAEVAFGTNLRLLGYDPQITDNVLDVTLYWQALAELDLDYTFFIHVLDGQGKVLTQWDGQAGNGAYPTSIWDAGEIVFLETGLSLSPGYDSIVVGVYYGPTGERLQAYDLAGAPLPANTLNLVVTP